MILTDSAEPAGCQSELLQIMPLNPYGYTQLLVEE